jgi:hypothetical protein
MGGGKMGWGEWGCVGGIYWVGMEVRERGKFGKGWFVGGKIF